MPAARTALLLATQLLAAAMLGACGDEPIANLTRDCEAPAGTSPLAFESDGRRLFGFVDAPSAAGPHPAILLVHDSGRTDVTHGNGDFAELRDAFRDAGFASVVWDRAGSGCSAGRYEGLADLYERADDVLAAAKALESHPAVDTSRLGAFAIGEGGWAASMAAARSDALKFLILVGAPAGDPIERLQYAAARRLERQGYAAADAEAVAGELGRALAMMRDQAPYREYRDAVERLSEHPLLPPLSEAGGDVHASERRYDELRESAVLHVESDVFVSAIEIPVLAIWGDRDEEVDWRKGVEIFRQAFDRAANPDATIEVIEGADHRLCDVGAAAAPTTPADGACRLADGYVETMTAWLRARAFALGAEPRQSRLAVGEPRVRGFRAPAPRARR